MMARRRPPSPVELASTHHSDCTRSQANQRAETGTVKISRNPSSTVARSSPRKKAERSYRESAASSCEESDCATRLQAKTTPKSNYGSKQIRLASLGTLSSKKPFSQISTTREEKKNRPRSPTVKNPTQRIGNLPNAVREASPQCDEPVEVEIEESIWCEANAASDDSDDELPSPSMIFPQRRRLAEDRTQPKALASYHAADIFGAIKSESTSRRDTLLEKNTDFQNCKKSPEVDSRPTTSSDKENELAVLRFSPPRLYSPSKRHLPERPATPPQSPSKSRLKSPSKTKARVPTPPLRPSLDAFWNSSTINEWNDQYSPQKVVKSPTKPKSTKNSLLASPKISPCKSQSPSKRTKPEIETRRLFDAGKHQMAENFLEELDRIITQGRISSLAASTGGVRVVWSKTLNSTAGRANWRRETTKSKRVDGTTTTEHKHFAFIELAEKVIDDEARLVNVMAHEFCHLATFMISGIKDNPHGRQFKEWGRACTRAFDDRGVEVTTKHSYEIAYKYLWRCSNEDCGVEFQRHSKSIDPSRHTCGSCRSKLVQIRPVPRKDAGTNGAGAVTGYAAFVKAHFADMKRSMPGGSQKEVMEAIGRKYRAEKAGGAISTGEEAVLPSKTTSDPCVDQVARVLEFITLDD